jgi:hypothetical protein
MCKSYAVLLVTLLAATVIKGQNVGINISGTPADASAMLDVSAANKGLLIPRLSLTAANSPSPVTSPAISLMVYNQNTAPGISPGYYTWNGAAWVRISLDGENWKSGGNMLTATGSLGTLSNNHVDLITNNLVRGRLTNLGEFFIGATNTVIPGDLVGGVSNSTFPFAVNGYSAFNGAGVYGLITGGNTQFAAVQGEYQASGAFNTAGVRGTNQSPTAGTGFRTLAGTGPRVGVIGNTTGASGQYTFGLHGSMGSTDIRCGGVYGDDFGIASGALAYYASTLADYSVYGFGNAYQVGVALGRSTYRLTEPNTQIGMGIYGGVMGGWVRGLVYGAHVKGERYGLYVDGKTYTNAPITELVPAADGSRIPTYAITSLSTDVYARGKATLQAGVIYIPFDKKFLSIINADDVVITITPTGNSRGLYIARQDSNGFVVRENEGGNGSVSFNWIAIGARKDNAPMNHAPEILAGDFDKNMNGVMFNDNNKTDKPQPVWWDGQNIRFDTPPQKMPDVKAVSNARNGTF